MIDVRALVAKIVADPAAVAELRRALGVSETREQLVSVATYAAERELAVVTVRRAIREGRLLCERVGRAVRVPRNAQIAPRARTARDGKREQLEHRLGIRGPK